MRTDLQAAIAQVAESMQAAEFLMAPPSLRRVAVDRTPASWSTPSLRTKNAGLWRAWSLSTMDCVTWTPRPRRPGAPRSARAPLDAPRRPAWGAWQCARERAPRPLRRPLAEADDALVATGHTLDDQGETVLQS